MDPRMDRRLQQMETAQRCGGKETDADADARTSVAKVDLHRPATPRSEGCRLPSAACSRLVPLRIACEGAQIKMRMLKAALIYYYLWAQWGSEAESAVSGASLPRNLFMYQTHASLGNILDLSMRLGLLCCESRRNRKYLVVHDDQDCW